MDIAPRLAIFRAGQHTAVDGRVLNFTAADLEQIASSYDAQNDAAPLVVGHPSIDAPAYGWAKTLRAENGVLYAEPDQVDAQFAEMVNAGRFKKISSSIYLPDSPGNPRPGQFYLRHIGFLGAAAPSVKGLKPASFGEPKAVFVEFSEAAAPMAGFGARVAQLFRSLRAHLASTSGADLGGILPDDALDSLASSSAASAGTTTASFADPTETSMSTTQAADFAEREKQLKDQTAALEAREKAIADNEKKIRREAAASFAEQLVKDGKILPREKAPVVELLMVLPADSAPLSFAEGDTTVSKPAAQALRELLTDLPKRIEYGRERTAEAGDAAAAVSFAAPDNVIVDPARLELLAKAKAYQAAHPNVSYVEAVRACGG